MELGPGPELVAPVVDIRSPFPRGMGKDARRDRDGTRLDARPLELVALTTSTGITALALDSGPVPAAILFAPVAGEIALAAGCSLGGGRRQGCGPGCGRSPSPHLHPPAL